MTCNPPTVGPIRAATRADRVRALCAASPLNKCELLALLPAEIDSLGIPRRVTRQHVSSTVGAMLRDGMLERVGGGRYAVGRPPRDESPEAIKARRRERQARYEAKRPRTVKRKARAKAKPVERSPIVRVCAPKHSGRVAIVGSLTAPPAVVEREELPDSQAFIDANPRKFQRLRAGDVSPASRFKYLEVSA